MKLFGKIIICLLIAAASALHINASDTDAGDGNVVFLLYHDLSAEQLDSDDIPEYCTTDSKFEEDIIRLFEMGYESINLEMYYNGDYDKDKNYFVITFDDGYLSNYTLAYPILIEQNAYADIFMCTESTTFDNHFTYAQAKKMEDSGLVKIYSHLTTHMDVTKLSAAEFSRLVRKSNQYLNKRISNDRLYMFAYPWNMFNEETAKCLYEEGTVLQFVQTIPADIDWDYTKYGIIKRVTVAYYSDIEQLVSDFINGEASGEFGEFTESEQEFTDGIALRSLVKETVNGIFCNITDDRIDIIIDRAIQRMIEIGRWTN